MYRQEVYYGAPGTGKSFSVDKILEPIDSSKKFRVTIHPEYTYSDFVGQLLPVTSEQHPVEFKFKSGPFTDALREAYANTAEEVFLIIEELSRGNAAAILGDIFQLLDRDQYGVSKYPIRNKDIADQIPTLLTDEIKLPSNFSILCTVNTNDQNVYPMDTAFKRRFDWKYISTSPALTEDGTAIDKTLNNPKLYINADPVVETNWQSFYMALNSFITDKNNGLGKDEDKQVGQFFIDFPATLITNSYSADDEVRNNAKRNVNEIIKNKLLQYLWQDVQGNSSFGTTVSLFDSDISSFEKLYTNYDITKVFGDAFIDRFLRPNYNNYPFE